MHVKFGDKTRQTKEKALRIIDFKPQTSPSDCIFKKNKILKISDFVKYKYALFVRKSFKTGKCGNLQQYVYPTKPKPRPQHSCCYKPSS